MLDNRSANAIVLMALIELLILLNYGVNRFMGHVDEMQIWMPRVMRYFWKTCWTIVTPAIIIYVTIMKWITHKSDSYLNYDYPGFAQFMGWGKLYVCYLKNR